LNWRGGAVQRIGAYLQHVFTELPKARPLEDVDALLPDRVQIGGDEVR
jgi:hypothetical protein